MGGSVALLRSFNYEVKETEVPFVTTNAPVGYTGSYIHYTPDEILSIVHVRASY